MDELLQRLRDWVDANCTRAFFNAPASPGDVDALEQRIGLRLPDDFRKFLLAFDGGFINTSPFKPDEDDWYIDNASWNSNHLLSIESIEKEYQQLASIGREVFG